MQTTDQQTTDKLIEKQKNTLLLIQAFENTFTTCQGYDASIGNGVVIKMLRELKKNLK